MVGKSHVCNHMSCRCNVSVLLLFHKVQGLLIIATCPDLPQAKFCYTCGTLWRNKRQRCKCSL